MRRLFIAALLSTTSVSSYAQATGDREPGIVIAIYETDGGLTNVPDLAGGQLPNSVKIAPGLYMESERNDFGVLENFVTEARAILTMKDAALVEFRLMSDDGARLWIDGHLVVDNDGLHGPDPKDGALNLSSGDHAVLVRHFQGSGGAALKMLWKPSGASDFTAIPPALLSHEKSAVPQTAPGKKRVIPGLRRGRPGDGSPVRGLNPGYASAPADERPRGLAIGLDGTPWTGLKAVTRPLDGLNSFVFLPPEAAGSAVGFLSRRFADVNSGSLVATCGTRALWRIELEKVGAVVQGAVLRFADNLPETQVRIVLNPKDGVLYTWHDENIFGAETMPPFLKLTPAATTPFEMKAVRALKNGLEIELSQALMSDIGWEPESYYIEQWPYNFEKREAPQRDGDVTPVKSVTVSPDRRKVFLEIDGLKKNCVVYVRLFPPCISESGEVLWSTEAWYTLREIPADRSGVVGQRPASPPQNVLSAAEKADGWKQLFDGQTLTGWHNFKKPGAVEGWKVIDGALVRTGPGGDLVTDQPFADFELKLDWRISPAGNSGVMFRVSEDESYPWRTGPEMQVLDNAEHPDGRNPKTSAGSNYALIAPPRDVTKPLGLFNEARILCKGNHVEYWLNGLKTAEYEINSPEWKMLVQASKFNEMPRYGQNKSGVIALQDHGDRVWYRNVRIRELK